MPDSPVLPSYEELAALVVELRVLLADRDVLVEALRVELTGLRREVGRDSSNSSQPPSTDGIGAKAKARAGKRSGELERQASSNGSPGEGPAAGGSGASGRRKQGGQPGHRGSGLARVAKADRSEAVEPARCVGCGAGLAGAPGRVASSVQVFDLPALALSVTEYLLMRRVCPCGRATTAD